MKELGTTKYRTYGALAEKPESELRLLIGQLIKEGYLYQTADTYSVLRVGNISPLKDPDTHVLVRMPEVRESEYSVAGGHKKSTAEI